MIALVEGSRMKRSQKQITEIAKQLVVEALRRHDPVHVFGAGAPDNELDREARSITAQLSRVTTIEDLAHVIQRVMDSSFGPGLVSWAQSSMIADDLHQKLVAAGVLSLT
jgi:hypothetical protein